MKKQLGLLSKGEALSEDDTRAVFSLLLDPDSDITDAQIGAYLFATSSRTPTQGELIAAAKEIRLHMLTFPRNTSVSLLDTCGTGGSGFSTFNTSTAVAFVCAAAGQAVAKHGNRAASSRSGSADVLEKLGVPLSGTQQEQLDRLRDKKFVFLFAPEHHPAAKRVALLRKELGLRTIFNFLGPLANPAQADFQLLGVSSKQALEPMSQALCSLGIKRALVVRGRDGLDELSCGAINDVYEIADGGISHYELDPQKLGVAKVAISEIEIESAIDSAQAMRSVLSGEASAYRELVVLNAGAALYISGNAASISEGIALAKSQLDSGAANKVLESLCQ